MNSTVFQMSVTTSTQPSGHVFEFDAGCRVLLAVLIIESFLTCVGNALTIIVICKDPALRTTGNMHIASLASADFIAGITGIIDAVWFTDEDLFAELNASKFWCLLWYVLFFTSFAASLFSMSLIALDRWIFITYSLKYHMWITPLKTSFMIGSAWIAAISFGLLSIAFNSYDTEGECSATVASSRAYLTYGMGVILFGSCAISFVFYYKIFLIARKHRPKCFVYAPSVSSPPSNTNGHSITGAQNITGAESITAAQSITIAENISHDQVNYPKRKRYKQIQIMFLICCITLCCWIPYFIINLPHVPKVSLEVSYFIESLAMLNSSANFFLYSAKNPAFRKSFLKLLPCFKH